MPIKSLLLLIFTAMCGWSAKFPIDTTIQIPIEGYPDDEIKVPISQLDTHLVFFTTPGTLSCPGSAAGDVKGTIKKPTASHPNPSQDVFLWTALSNCNSTPNSYTAYSNYYEYEYHYRGKIMYMKFVKFTGPFSFPSGTFPPIEFQIRIDTISNQATSLLKNGKVPEVYKRESSIRRNLLGRKVEKNLGPVFSGKNPTLRKNTAR